MYLFIIIQGYWLKGQQIFISLLSFNIKLMYVDVNFFFCIKIMILPQLWILVSKPLTPNEFFAIC